MRLLGKWTLLWGILLVKFMRMTHLKVSCHTSWRLIVKVSLTFSHPTKFANTQQIRSRLIRLANEGVQSEGQLEQGHYLKWIEEMVRLGDLASLSILGPSTAPRRLATMPNGRVITPVYVHGVKMRATFRQQDIAYIRFLHTGENRSSFDFGPDADQRRAAIEAREGREEVVEGSEEEIVPGSLDEDGTIDHLTQESG